MIIEGVNGVFVGSQETVIKANNVIIEAITRIKRKEKIKKEEKEAYIKTFEFRKNICGLSDEQEKYYNILKKKYKM